MLIKSDDLSHHSPLFRGGDLSKQVSSSMEKSSSKSGSFSVFLSLEVTSKVKAVTSKVKTLKNDSSLDGKNEEAKSSEPKKQEEGDKLKTLLSKVEGGVNSNLRLSMPEFIRDEVVGDMASPEALVMADSGSGEFVFALNLDEEENSIKERTGFSEEKDTHTGLIDELDSVKEDLSRIGNQDGVLPEFYALDDKRLDGIALPKENLSENTANFSDVSLDKAEQFTAYHIEEVDGSDITEDKKVKKEIIHNKLNIDQVLSGEIFNGVGEEENRDLTISKERPLEDQPSLEGLSNKSVDEAQNLDGAKTNSTALPASVPIIVSDDNLSNPSTWEGQEVQKADEIQPVESSESSSSHEGFQSKNFSHLQEGFLENRKLDTNFAGQVGPEGNEHVTDEETEKFMLKDEISPQIEYKQEGLIFSNLIVDASVTPDRLGEGSFTEVPSSMDLPSIQDDLSSEAGELTFSQVSPRKAEELTQAGGENYQVEHVEPRYVEMPEMIEAVSLPYKSSTEDRSSQLPVKTEAEVVSGKGSIEHIVPHRIEVSEAMSGVSFPEKEVSTENQSHQFTDIPEAVGIVSSFDKLSIDNGSVDKPIPFVTSGDDDIPIVRDDHNIPRRLEIGEYRQEGRQDLPVDNSLKGEVKEEIIGNKDFDHLIDPDETLSKEPVKVNFEELLRSDKVDPRFQSIPLRGPQYLSDGVNNVVRFINSRGETRAQIIVDPPALGKIHIELKSTPDGMEATLRVESTSVRDMIKPQIPLLQDMLSQQGIALSGMNVDVHSGDGKRRDWNSPEGRRRKLEDDEDLDQDFVARLDLEDGLLVWTA